MVGGEGRHRYTVVNTFADLEGETVSALCGVVYLDGRPADAGDLEAPMAAMEHHAVDGMSVWAAGPAVLGHQMLWVTPESKMSSRPYHDSEAGLTITADVRLDNREELFAALRCRTLSGERHRTAGSSCSPISSGVRRHRFICWGTSLLAIWDAHSRRSSVRATS